MDTIRSLIQRAQKTEHGFMDILKAADEVFASHSVAETLQMAKELFTSDVHQARVLAVFLFGKLAAKSKESFTILRKRVSLDQDWRVQETLAKAFDQQCRVLAVEPADAGPAEGHEPEPEGPALYPAPIARQPQ